MARTLVHSVVAELQRERNRLQNELHRITAALTAFGKVYTQGKKAPPAARRKHRISAQGRKRIAAAQRARWAKVRARKKQR